MDSYGRKEEYTSLTVTDQPINTDGTKRLFGIFPLSILSLTGLSKRRAWCEPSTAMSEFVKRAESDVLREIFLKYASIEKGEENFMNYNDFVRSFLGLLTDENYNTDTVKRLANCVDTTKNGLISYMEFQAFEALLCAPDAIYAVAFQLFDSNSSGFINYGEFENFIKETEVYKHTPFNFDCDFIHLHFGKKRERRVSYAEFTQLLHDFHDEHALQAFHRQDKDNEGYISPLDFHDIMTRLKGHLITEFVGEHLVRVAGGGKGGLQVSYPYFIAFIYLLNNMELVKKIYSSASKGTLTKEVTKDLLALIDSGIKMDTHDGNTSNIFILDIMINSM